MSASSPASVLAQLQWRYATKKFDSSRIIAPEVWNVLEQALVLTPSSYGLQPWKFYVVTNPAIKEKLPALSWGQSQPRDCSHMVVLAIRENLVEADIDRYVTRISDVRGQSLDSLASFKRMMVGSLTNPPFDINDWAARQVYIALGQFMTAAAIVGVDTCPMEGIDPGKYDELLGIAEQGYRTVVACPAGYRAADDKSARAAKVRFRTEDVIQHI